MVPRTWLAQGDGELEGLLSNTEQTLSEIFLNRICNFLKCTREELRLGFGGFLLSLALDGSMYSNEVFREELKQVRLAFYGFVLLCKDFTFYSVSGLQHE